MEVFKKSKNLEKDLQKKVLNYLRSHHQLGWWRKLSDKTASHLPDIIGVYCGKSIAIELKREGQKLRPGQEAELKAHSSAGGLSAWFDSYDKFKEEIDRICSILKRMDSNGNQND